MTTTLTETKPQVRHPEDGRVPVRTSAPQRESYPALSNSRMDQRKDGRMYAIAFDLDTDTLQRTYGSPSHNNAYGDIRKRLLNHGFNWQQGSVYFGSETVNAVTCVVAVIDLTRTFGWFAGSVRDIRMLRIEEQNDLTPAIQSAAGGE
jgi:virulence-associated protein VapD